MSSVFRVCHRAFRILAFSFLLKDLNRHEIDLRLYELKAAG